MSDTNPWQSPEAAVKVEESAVQGILTAAMIRYLKESSPWLRFIGILGYVGAVFFIVSGLAAAVAAIVTGGGLFSGVSGAVSVFLGLIYVVSGAAAFFYARFTHAFGAKIRNYLQSGAERDLEEAFKNNRSLWKFTGILAIVGISFVPLGIVAVLVTALSSVF
ncbi:MAG: hypothetical protein LBH51_01090 [Treponema sp.]|nr:hypothetical protein [Treponema sp.]